VADTLKTMVLLGDFGTFRADRMSGVGKTVFGRSPSICEALPEHVPYVVRTIGATARERRFDGSPAITRAMPISSALETS
jgi:hypothetical protein